MRYGNPLIPMHYNNTEQFSSDSLEFKNHWNLEPTPYLVLCNNHNANKIWHVYYVDSQMICSLGTLVQIWTTQFNPTDQKWNVLLFCFYFSLSFRVIWTEQSESDAVSLVSFCVTETDKPESIIQSKYINAIHKSQTF